MFMSGYGHQQSLRCAVLLCHLVVEVFTVDPTSEGSPACVQARG